jgi:hypothetical protein
MEIGPQALDRKGVFTRMTSATGVPDRISSSQKNLRASIRLEAKDKPIIFRRSEPLRFRIDRSVLVLDLCHRILYSAEDKFYARPL